MKKVLHVVAFSWALGLIPVVNGFEFIPAAYAAGCTAKENLNEKAGLFIIRCRRASIYREFPSELLNATLGTIKQGGSATHKKAWKLLNDNRFAK
jgi:hypothetical protein